MDKYFIIDPLPKGKIRAHKAIVKELNKLLASGASVHHNSGTYFIHTNFFPSNRREFNGRISDKFIKLIS